jgi:phosphopantetheine adenylyltransferase
MRMYHFELACVSGAFSVLHKGQEEFLDSAFRVAERVLILVQSDELAQLSRPYLMPPLSLRLEQLDRFLLSRGYAGSYEAVMCTEALSEADAWLNPRIDCLVVSEEMFTAADLANRQRRKLGLRAFSIRITQRVLDGDGEVLSATNLLKRTAATA